MKVAVGADHGGFELKNVIRERLLEQGHEVTDVGSYDDRPSDYPDWAYLVAEEVNQGRAERGVVVCGSGVGACVAANKVPGIRAVLAHDSYSAHQGVEHDDVNILCLGARVVGPELALELVDIFLAARFSGEERHVRRLGKVQAIERKFLKEK
ncbi:MAG: hypothetical protein Kow00129_03620 [Thermoleophilia bacterium]